MSCSKPPCPELHCPGRERMPPGGCCRECQPIVKMEPRVLESTYRGEHGAGCVEVLLRSRRTWCCGEQKRWGSHGAFGVICCGSIQRLASGVFDPHIKLLRPHTNGCALLGPGAMGDEGQEMSQEDILLAGGCRKGSMVYRNGDTWHPRIASIGLMPCITCRCRVSEHSAGRRKVL